MSYYSIIRLKIGCCTRYVLSLIHGFTQVSGLNELSKQGYSVNYEIALIYCGLGDEEKAFESLGKACEEKDDMMDFKVDPAWDNLRSDPRYKSLIQRMNLE